MKLIINGEEKQIEAKTLEALMIELGGYETKSAVAVNGGFIPKSSHATMELSAGDEIEILSPMQGG